MSLIIPKHLRVDRWTDSQVGPPRLSGSCSSWASPPWLWSTAQFLGQWIFKVFRTDLWFLRCFRCSVQFSLSVAWIGSREKSQENPMIRFPHQSIKKIIKLPMKSPFSYGFPMVFSMVFSAKNRHFRRFPHLQFQRRGALEGLPSFTEIRAAAWGDGSGWSNPSDPSH